MVLKFKFSTRRKKKILIKWSKNSLDTQPDVSAADLGAVENSCWNILIKNIFFSDVTAGGKWLFLFVFQFFLRQLAPYWSLDFFSLCVAYGDVEDTLS